MMGRKKMNYRQVKDTRTIFKPIIIVKYFFPYLTNYELKTEDIIYTFLTEDKNYF